ncbi:hypothetical protein E4U42_000108 [Claviceps africana]|uniref:Phospholipase A2 n=1 Tax=Claviceps africana TaxID=83212 RepID=A0A8K0J0X6_9HYPO|nr:hypothetical protein E4U42_000108 [Claviceps africana]
MKVQLLVSTLLAASCEAIRMNPKPTVPMWNRPEYWNAKAHIPDVDRLMWDYTLKDFISRRNLQIPKWVDWTSDGCTHAPDNPFGFNYVIACYRHDFAYQNYRHEERFTRENKESIDLRFHDDLLTVCDEEDGLRKVCDTLAHIYYYGVHFFGGMDAGNKVPAPPAPHRELGDAPATHIEQFFEILIGNYEREVQFVTDLGLLPVIPGGVRAGLEPLLKQAAELDKQGGLHP